MAYLEVNHSYRMGCVPVSITIKPRGNMNWMDCLKKNDLENLKRELRPVVPPVSFCNNSMVLGVGVFSASPPEVMNILERYGFIVVSTERVDGGGETYTTIMMYQP